MIHRIDGVLNDLFAQIIPTCNNGVLELPRTVVLTVLAIDNQTDFLQAPGLENRMATLKAEYHAVPVNPA